MLHRAVGASILSPLRPGHEYRPALDEAVGLGWNIVRTFCGALPWCGQEIGHVYERLPPFLGELQARGLNGYLAYHTEAGTGYDLEQHTDDVEGIARQFPVVVLREVANEADHSTQGGRLDPDRCADLADRMDGPVSFGATLEGDESDTYAGRDHTSVHLDRGPGPVEHGPTGAEIYAHTERSIPARHRGSRAAMALSVGVWRDGDRDRRGDARLSDPPRRRQRGEAGVLDLDGDQRCPRESATSSRLTARTPWRGCGPSRSSPSLTRARSISRKAMPASASSPSRPPRSCRAPCASAPTACGTGTRTKCSCSTTAAVQALAARLDTLEGKADR